MVSCRRVFSRTTKTGVRDFCDMVGPFAGPERSQLTTTKQIDRVTCGKDSAISTPRNIKKSFYINELSAGGGGGIRTHGALARTTVFETAPFDHSGTPPLGAGTYPSS